MQLGSSLCTGSIFGNPRGGKGLHIWRVMWCGESWWAVVVVGWHVLAGPMGRERELSWGAGGSIGGGTIHSRSIMGIPSL